MRNWTEPERKIPEIPSAQVECINTYDVYTYTYICIYVYTHTPMYVFAHAQIINKISAIRMRGTGTKISEGESENVQVSAKCFLRG